MNEARTFRRAFAIGLLTLGVAVGGQVATQKLAGDEPQPSCPIAAMRSAQNYTVHGGPRTDGGSLAHRVARAVIGAMLCGFA
jgi:hypothetical protein